MKLPISQNGIPDYYWPLEREFVLQPLENISSVIYNYAAKNDTLHAALPILQKWILIEALKTIEATILYEELKKKDFFYAKNHYRLLKAFMNDDLAIHGQEIAQGFARPYPKGINLPLPLKMTIRNFQRNGPFKTFSHILKNDNYITIDPHSLVLANAKKNEVYLEHHHLSSWMQDIRPNFRAGINLPKATATMVNDIQEVIHMELQNRGFKLSENLGNYIATLIQDLIKITLLRIQAIEKNLVNRKMWVGSSGANYFVKIMAHTARRNNGYVVAHDHGFGNAQVDLNFGSHVVEYNTCDEFVTYTDHIAKIKRKEIKQDWLFGMPKPQIKSVYTSSYEEGEAVQAPKIKTLMYTATAYHSERVRLRPIPSDTSYFDFQMKLFNHLKKHDIKILYKPHPEGQFSPTKELAEYFDVELVHGAFEDLKLTVDAYLMDFLASSMTAPALASDKPIMFINLGYPALKKEAENILKHRCDIIHTKIDSENRINVDWDKLSDFLNRNQHSFNKTFSNMYYGDSIR